MGSTPVSVFLPQVTRIPIAGPSPFNTLVCCTPGGSFIIGGAGTGNITRGQLRLFSNFVLQGFDQRVAPNFQHSTSGWLVKIGPSEDDNWIYAIDSIADAGFDPTGLFFVDINFAVQYGQPPAPDNQAEYQICVCSFVLVNEPPVSRAGGQGQTRIALQGLQLPSGFPRIHALAGTTGAPLFAAIASSTPIRAASPAAASQSARCQCGCYCCRKGKCVRQQCTKRGCNCTCPCCRP